MKEKAFKEKKARRLLHALVLLTLLVLIAVSLIACSGGADKPQPTESTAASQPAGSQNQESQPTEEEKVKAYDFTLLDQSGQSHQLAAYEGKVIFLNFWATWCPPCKAELPDVEALYKDHKLNQEDLVVLGVVYPGVGQEMDEEGIKAFLRDNDISFPVLMDTTGEVYESYRITGMPTTFLIDHRGDFIGYVQGAMPRELMDLHVDKALEAID